MRGDARGTTLGTRGRTRTLQSGLDTAAYNVPCEANLAAHRRLVHDSLCFQERPAKAAVPQSPAKAAVPQTLLRLVHVPGAPAAAAALATKGQKQGVREFANAGPPSHRPAAQRPRPAQAAAHAARRLARPAAAATSGQACAATVRRRGTRSTRSTRSMLNQAGAAAARRRSTRIASASASSSAHSWVVASQAAFSLLNTVAASKPAGVGGIVCIHLWGDACVRSGPACTHAHARVHAHTHTQAPSRTHAHMCARRPPAPGVIPMFIWRRMTSASSTVSSRNTRLKGPRLLNSRRM